MIDINLVPPQLRRKRKKSSLPGGFKIPLEVVIGCGGGLVILLIFIHVGLLVLTLVKLSNHRDLKRQITTLAPQKAEADVAINEMRSLQKRLDAITGLTQTRTLVWSQKLNVISDQLPRGVWLKRVSLEDQTLYIQGSAISRKSDEMFNVHTFTSSLKNNEAFTRGLSNIELGSIQRRPIQKVEVADFILTAQKALETNEDPGTDQ